MTIEGCYALLEKYRLDLGMRSRDTNVCFALDMLPRMREMLDHSQFALEDDHDAQQQWEKFMRWLGFVQGVCYITQVYSLEQMKEHNRAA